VIRVATDMDLYVTDHVRNRWFQRSDDPVMSPRVAWEDGEQIRAHGLQAEEVRYHGHTGTLLLRIQERLVTVMDVDNLQSRARAAVEQRRQA